MTGEIKNPKVNSASNAEQIPAWLSSHLTAADLDRIEIAVKKAEAKTSAELVPLVVQRSTTPGHPHLTITALLTSILMIISWPFHEWWDLHHGATILPVLIALFAVLSFPLAMLGFVQRLLMPDADRDLQVHRRAWAEFAALKIAGTKDRRGLLIMVSVFERKVVVLADEGLARLLEPHEVSGWSLGLARHLRKGRWEAAFEETLREIAARLEKIVPRESGSLDELGNRLRMKE